MVGKAGLAIVAVMLGYAAQSAGQPIELKGVVTDSNRQPLGGARITAVPNLTRYWQPSDMEALSATQSGKAGEFTLSVPSDTTVPLALIAWAPNHRMMKFAVNNPRAASQRTLGMALEAGHTLTGRIVDAATGNPVAGAQLGPLVPGYDVEPRRAQRVVPQWQTSGPDGSFTLDGLTPDAAHTLLVQAPGYGMVNLELSAGQQTAEVKIGAGGYTVQGEIFARNRPPASFSGTRVWANGNGFDVTTSADANGHFSFTGMPGGTFSIQPLLPDTNRAVRVHTAEFPRDHGTSVSLEVSSGYYVRGLALDRETSTPAQGVAIELNDQWTTTGADGAFALGPYFHAAQFTPQVSQPDGWQLDQVVSSDEDMQSDGFTDITGNVLEVRRQRLLDITLDNFDQTTQPVVVSVLAHQAELGRQAVTTSSVQIPVFHADTYMVYATSGGMSSPLEVMQVNRETSIPITLRMQPGANVTGRVVVHNSPDTTRVQTLRLGLAPALGSASAPNIVESTAPAPDGSFRFPALPAGNFVISLTNESRTRETTRAITLAPGENPLEDLVWDAGNRISGRVMGPGDQPVMQANVSLALSDHELIKVQTDQNGRYKAEDLPANKLITLMVEANAYAVHREQDVPLPADNKEIMLARLGMLNITVDAEPWTKWRVYVVRISPWATGAYAQQLMGQPIVEKDMQASELFEVPLGESGTFRVVAVSRSNNNVMVSAPIAWKGTSGTSEDVILSDARTGTISGSAGDTDTPIQITAMNTTLPESAGTDKTEFTAESSGGRFQLTGLTPGNYLLLGQAAGYSAYTLNVDVAPGQSVTANLAPAQTTAITGTVTVLGENLPQATVNLLSETDPTVAARNTQTDAQGAFAFDGILPDSYSLSVTYSTENGDISTRKSVVVKDGENPAPVVLDLTPPKPVTFTIAPSAALTPGAEIFLMSKETRQLTPAQWTNGALGANVPPGQYEVWVGDTPGSATATVNADGTGTIQ